MRGTVLIVVALFIDGLQAALTVMFFIIGLGFQITNPIGGAAVGFFSGGLSGAALGGAAGTIGLPLGIGLGFAASTCLSIMGGCFLGWLLAHNKMLYPKFLFTGGLAEIIPGFDILPAWTAIVALSILEKSKEEGGAVGAVAGVATAVASPSLSSVAGAAAGVAAASRPVDGIRAADNNPTTAESYAA